MNATKRKEDGTAPRGLLSAIADYRWRLQGLSLPPEQLIPLLVEIRSHLKPKRSWQRRVAKRFGSVFARNLPKHVAQDWEYLSRIGAVTAWKKSRHDPHAWLFFRLQFPSFRGKSLSTVATRAAVQQALKDGDEKFFIRFGRALQATKPFAGRRPAAEYTAALRAQGVHAEGILFDRELNPDTINKTAELIIANWDQSTDPRIPPLKHFSMPMLREYCRRRLDLPISQEALEKLVVRHLGLHREKRRGRVISTLAELDALVPKR